MCTLRPGLQVKTQNLRKYCSVWFYLQFSPTGSKLGPDPHLMCSLLNKYRVAMYV